MVSMNGAHPQSASFGKQSPKIPMEVAELQQPRGKIPSREERGEHAIIIAIHVLDRLIVYSSSMNSRRDASQANLRRQAAEPL